MAVKKARNAAYAEEKAEVEVLKGQVFKHAELGKRLQALESRLRGGGNSVFQSIGTIHDNSREHQTIANNIDKMNSQIDKMLEPSQDKSKEARIIQAGPTQVGLPDYLASVRRVERGITEMAATNMRAQQGTVGDYNELRNQGILKLEDVFRTLVSERVQPIEPLHYITKDLAFPSISKEKTSQLAAVSSVLCSPNAPNAGLNEHESPSALMYAECRSPYLVASLQSLSIASVNTAKKTNPDELYRPGTSAIGMYANAIQGMFQAESQNISTIFQHQDWGIVLEKTGRKAVIEFANTLRELNRHIKSNLTNDCFLAYEIIEIVTPVAYRLNQELGYVKQPFADALKPIRETAKASLAELLEDQRRRIGTLSILPSDGGAISFTSETMNRLQTTTSYPTSLSSILASMGDGNWTNSNTARANSSTSLPSLKPLDVGADGTTLLVHYLLDAIETHFNSLDSRSRTLHRSKAVSGVFLSNTVAVIDRMIRSSDLASLLSANPVAQHKFESWRKKGTSTYLDAWKEPCQALLDVQYTSRPGNRPQSGANMPSEQIVKGLSSKDKDAIKQKFKDFNTSFDECVKRHKEMMPSMEREVRSGLARDIGNVVEPLYARFWDRYEALDRGKGKYVKFDKGGLSGLLAALG